MIDSNSQDIGHNEELQPPTTSQTTLNFGTIRKSGSKIFQVPIRNPSKQPLLWRADAGEANWLAPDKRTGILQKEGEQQIVNVKADTSSLEVGEHTATLTFTSEGDESSVPVKVPITARVFPVLPLAVGLSFALNRLSSKTLPLAIINRNDQPVNWTADIGGTSWLSLDRRAGTLQPHEQQAIHVTANTSFLEYEDYAAVLTFSSDVLGVKSEDTQFPVELHVTPVPYGDNGPKPPCCIRVLNSVTGQLSLEFGNVAENGQVNWTLNTGGVNWLSVDPSAGTLQPGDLQTVLVTIDISGLQAGNYRTDLILTFTFNPEREGREPTSVLIPVTLTAP